MVDLTTFLSSVDYCSIQYVFIVLDKNDKLSTLMEPTFQWCDGQVVSLQEYSYASGEGIVLGTE